MAKLRGIDHLRRACGILCEDPRPAADRLAEALHAFWTASTEYDSWPPEFQKRADEVRRLIFGGGTIKETAAAMTETEFADLKRKVCSFAEDAERVGGERHVGGPHLPVAGEPPVRRDEDRRRTPSGGEG